MTVAWEPEISVDVVTLVGVPVEETLVDIGMNTRNVVIHLEYYCDTAWISYLGYTWTTHSA